MRLIHYPAKSLTVPCPAVTEFNEELVEQAREMLKAVVEFKGLALAANQVGINKRMFVTALHGTLFHPDAHYGTYPRIIVNPEIHEPVGQVLYKESCLSIPGVEANNRRIAAFDLRFYDERGTYLSYPAVGVFAVMCQHEIDHLDGRLFIDSLEPFERSRVAKRINKLRKRI